jgi:hypothetical protein
MNVSRDNVRQSSEDVHGFYKGQDEKHPYPSEKEPLASSSRRNSRDGTMESVELHHPTTTTSRGVHYPDSDGQGPSPKSSVPRPVPSRQSSFASDLDDDEEDVYNWSDEEDLVDQEAKFEQKMGKNANKKKGWSFGRYFPFHLVH